MHGTFFLSSNLSEREAAGAGAPSQGAERDIADGCVQRQAARRPGGKCRREAGGAPPTLPPAASSLLIWVASRLPTTQREQGGLQAAAGGSELSPIRGTAGIAGPRQKPCPPPRQTAQQQDSGCGTTRKQKRAFHSAGRSPELELRGSHCQEVVAHAAARARRQRERGPLGIARSAAFCRVVLRSKLVLNR